MMDTIQDLAAGIMKEASADAEIVEPEFLQDFIVEAKEHIENIEASVLDLEANPSNQEIIHNLFRSFHTIKGLAGFVNQNLIQKIAHQTETLMDECRKGKLNFDKEIADLILTSSDLIKKICEDFSLAGNPEFVNDAAAQLVNLECLVTDGPVHHGVCSVSTGPAIPAAPNSPKTEDQPGQMGLSVSDGLGQAVAPDPQTAHPPIPESPKKQGVGSERQAIAEGGMVRIPTVKIDNLGDMVGELMIIQSLIEQEAVKQFDTNNVFINDLLRMGRITKDLQNLTMSLRMVSLKSTFQKINRIGRDAVVQTGKKISLDISGEDTEIDRNVADKILDPLVHLVKNAIAHGIETEAERLRKGKPGSGTVRIQAYRKRGNVYIEIADDGGGLNLEKIYQKALEKNLINPAQKYSSEEITSLIFLPGFSTAAQIDNISGRGVGMDVVKTEILKIGGKIEIVNRPGQGCTFILRIPINLAAINGTIVEIAGNNYILPTVNVKKIIKPEPEQWVSVTGVTRLIRDREQIIPVIPIAKVFGIPDISLEQFAQLIVIMELEQKIKALPVQNIIGRREIVVKSLGEDFSTLSFASGASILGDGKVSLILDVENLFKMEAE